MVHAAECGEPRVCRCQEAKQKKARAKRERQKMQVYTGEFFKEPSPDFESSVDDGYFGIGAAEQTELETIGFGVPVNASASHTAAPHSDYWDIPPSKYVAVCQFRSFVYT